MAPDDFEALRNRCLEKLDATDSEWLGTRLKYANESTLRERLRGLWAIAGDAVLPFVEHPNRWVSVVAGVRNSLTHMSSGRTHFEGADLYFLSESIYTLLRACMLSRIGVSPTFLAEKAFGYQFSWYASRLEDVIDRLRRHL